MYVETTATQKIKRLNKRIRLVAGGTSASKTVSILLYLIARAQTDKSPTLTSIVSESFPHLRRGSMRDFLNIMQEHGYFDDARWSKTEYTYTFETGSKIEFFSADQPSKVRGPRRHRLFVNEANNIAAEAWEQLLIRTSEFAFADWNPTSDFYIYDDYIQDEDAMTTTTEDAEFIILTYKDNEALEAAIVREIERRQTNKNWWRVYGEGKRGEVEGKVYRDWQIIEELPHEARLTGRGLDFGYSNDPTAIVDIYEYNGGYILDERLYQKGMSNKQIADFLKNLSEPQALVVADSSEPKSIDEISSYGINIIPATKGPGSVAQGIQYVQDQRISITKRSTNGIREYRNYMWNTDKEGKIINVPIDLWNHFLDAARYKLSGEKMYVNVAPYKPKQMMKRKYAR
jgi:phage terminase large subunit